MASTKMELSLDDIIKTNPKVRRGGARGGRGGVGGRGGRGGRGVGGGGGLTRRGGLGGGRGGLGGGLRRSGGGGGRASFGRSPRGAADGIWVHDKFQDGGFGRRTGGIRTASGAGGAGGGGGSKITVSNLHYGVSDADIIELFGEIGAIRYASVHYDRSGRSMGKADVVFDRRGDAQNAINQYNGVPLDGRAMAITFANAPTAVAISPRSPIRQVQGGRIGRRPGTGPVRGRGGRGRGTGGRGAGGGRGGKKPAATPTAAELDAELDAYISANPK